MDAKAMKHMAQAGVLKGAKETEEATKKAPEALWTGRLRRSGAAETMRRRGNGNEDQEGRLTEGCEGCHQDTDD